MKTKKKKVLVTGARGFIGSHLTKQFFSQNIPFEVVERTRWPEQLLNLNLGDYSAVVHLATSPITRHKSLASLRHDNVDSVLYILQRIRETNPACGFIFVSSQSANPDTASFYGKLKWECEEVMRRYDGNWTLVKPALVVGKGHSGLFPKINALIDRFPIIPLIGTGDYPVQVVALSTVIEAITSISQDPQKHRAKEYVLASEPVAFKELLTTLAKLKKKKRMFLPIPIELLKKLLWIVELLPSPPVTRTNLLGLIQSEQLFSSASCHALELAIPAPKEILRITVENQNHVNLEDEARFFHRSLFSFDPSPELVEQYVRAHQFCCRPTNVLRAEAISTIVQKALDIEAIEYVLRSHSTEITKKIWLLCYLTEIKERYYALFVNEKKKNVTGICSLALATLRVPWKLVKGKYLIWRYCLLKKDAFPNFSST